MSADRLGRLVSRLFERHSIEALATKLNTSAPVVGVFLHGPLAEALPNVLRGRGHELVRVFPAWQHGLNVSAASGPISSYFGETAEWSIPDQDPAVSGSLLRHLKAGRSLYLALDKVASGATTPKVEMLGQVFARNDGPAWIAVRSGRPLALWTTENSPRGVVINSSPLFFPDASLPVEARVAALSERLYALAEAAIRKQPGDWTYWHALTLITGRAAL